MRDKLITHQFVLLPLGGVGMALEQVGGNSHVGCPLQHICKTSVGEYSYRLRLRLESLVVSLGIEGSDLFRDRKHEI